MCFVLYAAARKRPRLIPSPVDPPAFHVAEVGGNEDMVRGQFTLPEVVYIGSDQGCGCGFRYSLSDGYSKAAEIEFDDANLAETQPNQLKLKAYLEEDFKEEPFIELYGCWSGDEGQPRELSAEINLSQITDPKFCFRERGFYRVILGDGG